MSRFTVEEIQERAKIGQFWAWHQGCPQLFSVSEISFVQYTDFGGSGGFTLFLGSVMLSFYGFVSFDDFLLYLEDRDEGQYLDKLEKRSRKQYELMSDRLESLDRLLSCLRRFCEMMEGGRNE